uniref:Secreted protein n=1 Tax=Denticeps clupeoides TaxID=299321 RepID=A0AAY4ETY9_9TELE
MLSMASPFSSFFSISTMSLTPSTTHWTWSTSEDPMRSALEMSNTPPTEAVSTPPSGWKGAVWSESPQTWRVCRCPGWMGRSGCSRGAHST